MEHHQLLQSICIIITPIIIVTIYLLSMLLLLGYEVFPQKVNVFKVHLQMQQNSEVTNGS